MSNNNEFNEEFEEEFEEENNLESGKKGFKFKYVTWLVMVVELVAVGLLGYNLMKMSVVPNKYLIIGAGAIILFNVLLILSTKKLWTAIIMTILACVLTAGLFYGLHAVTSVHATIEEITDTPEEQITEMSIVVLKDSGVQQITDLKEYMIGYVGGSDYEFAKKTMEEINKEVGGEVTYNEFSDNIAMIDALYAKTTDAIIINSAYLDLLEEIEGYEDFADKTKVVYFHEIITYIDIVEKKDSDLDSFIVYFSGIDRFGHVTATSRSDVNILAVVNTKTKKILLVNTPRDSYVELVDKGGYDKLTHAGLYGIDCSMGALENVYDIDINYYVRMNFSGFENIIDSLGGIDVYSEQDFTVEPIKHYTVGMNHLTGLEALAFARERKSFADGDLQRGRNQMAVITAMVDKMSSKEMLYNYADVLASISDSFQTNMSSEDIYSLVREQLEDGQGWTVETYSVTGTGDYKTTYSVSSQELYVMMLNDSQVQEAKKLIEETLNEK